MQNIPMFFEKFVVPFQNGSVDGFGAAGGHAGNSSNKILPPAHCHLRHPYCNPPNFFMANSLMNAVVPSMPNTDESMQRW